MALVEEDLEILLLDQEDPTTSHKGRNNMVNSETNKGRCIVCIFLYALNMIVYCHRPRLPLEQAARFLFDSVHDELSPLSFNPRLIQSVYSPRGNQCCREWSKVLFRYAWHSSRMRSLSTLERTLLAPVAVLFISIGPARFSSRRTMSLDVSDALFIVLYIETDYPTSPIVSPSLGTSVPLPIGSFSAPVVRFRVSSSSCCGKDATN